MRDLSNFYKELEVTHGKAIAEGVADFYSIYTDDIYKVIKRSFRSLTLP